MTHFVIILGCGRGLVKKNGQWTITRESHLYNRLIKGMEVFNRIDTDDKFFLCSGGGKGEAEMMRQFLVARNIRDRDIFSETYSKNTIENCLYSYEMINKWLLFEPNTNSDRYFDTSNIKIHVVTSLYHLKRSLVIFNYFVHRLVQNAEIKYSISGHPCETSDTNDAQWEKVEKYAMSKIEKDFERYNIRSSEK